MTTQTQETICQNKKEFIKNYPEYGTVGSTLKSIGIKSRNTFYRWMEADPNFKRVYEEELLPNRRDDVASVVYRMGTAHKSVALCPVCEGSGKYDDKQCHGCKGRGWVEVRADGVQLTAAFGFLKATDHVDNKYDKLIFIEKNQIEFAGKDGGPVVIRVVEDGSN